MYRSPLHILSDWQQDPSSASDPAHLLRLRKKILAEFNLSDSPTITISEKTYSKDQIIKTIDLLLDNPGLPLHTFIFANKDLLNFLEDENSTIKPLRIRTMLIPPGIRGSLNSLLLERFIHSLKKAFYHKDFEEINEVWVSQPGFDEMEKGVYNDEIYKQITYLITQIEELPQYNIAEMPGVLPYLSKNTLSTFFNSLPEEFRSITDSFTAAVINTLVAYQQKVRGADKYYMSRVSQVLTEMECDEELMQLINKNHKVFTGTYTPKDEGDNDTAWVLRVIFFFIVVGALVARNFTCQPGSKHITGNAMEHWPAAPATNEARNFESYRDYTVKKGFNRTIDRTMDAEAYLDRSFSGRSPFSYILESENALPDSSFKSVIIDNKTALKLIIITHGSTHADAFLFFPGQPDTLSFRPGDKVCFYFGDSTYRFKEPLQLGNTLLAKMMSELYFKTSDPMALALFQKDFILELKPGVQRKNKKRPGPVKKTKLTEMELTDDFFITQKLETKSLELLPVKPSH